MAGKKKITGALEVSGSIVSVEEPLVVETKEILWAGLVALRDAGELIPGQQYRITDYTCTTVQANTQSAGHQFDIIVTADDVNKLNENAKAIKHSSDTYFANSKLEAWQLKYRLDNDTARFAWADSVNGKGVIYQMVDEFNNDVPYDFKNIQFKKANVWYYTFVDDLVGDSHDNKISAYILNSKATLNANTSGIRFYANTFGANCYDNTFGNSCDSNTFGIRCYANTFLALCHHNTLGDGCSSNTFNNSCQYNTFGKECTSNALDYSFSHNTFGDDCDSNTFGNSCNNNTFGSYCRNNTFGNSCTNNTFGDECQYLQISDTTTTRKKYIHVENATKGASTSNKFDLYDSATSNKDYQVTFKKSASGKYLMLWATDTGAMTGKVKDSNIDTTWADIV